MKRIIIVIIVALTLLSYQLSFAQDARAIVKRANDQMRGLTSYTEFSMSIVKPEWSRTFTIKAWSIEPDYALMYILEPVRDKGSVTLKRKNEVWNWLPSVQRVIKIPPSMMLQSWMGSDFSNDDLVRQSSLIDDYGHKLIGEENVQGHDCYKIELIPKPEAGVVWGKIVMWISKKDVIEYRSDFYDEDGVLIKSFVGSDVKNLGGRMLPARWEMIPVNEPGKKTILEYKEMKFDINIDAAFFSEQNMKKVR
jgi:outer membrane lipoprotein-sorting protein